jgi:hypothetical protein
MPPANNVRTPGSYGDALQGNGKVKKVGRPLKFWKKREFAKRRDKYSEEDMLEAMRLVREEEYSIKTTSKLINSVRRNEVPYMTLSDRLKRPGENPPLGRPQELSCDVEEVLVQCLEMCAEFQYPLKKKDLQDLVQSYCVINSVKTRWENDRPGYDWIRSFKDRWRHRVKVKKPSNIKRSKAKVSPDDIKGFFKRLKYNVEGIPPTHIFNFDESPIKDEPGAEDAFFAKGQNYYEQVMNHSKVGYSLMFCCNVAEDMLPPMVIYKSGTGILCKIWCNGGLEGTTHAANKSGWFDMAMFTEWFTGVGFYTFTIIEKTLFF